MRFKARNIFPLVENLEDKVNQDKISFAVEQLEQLEEALDNLRPISNHFEYDCEFGFDDCRYKVEDMIDEKIKQLKEGQDV